MYSGSKTIMRLQFYTLLNESITMEGLQCVIRLRGIIGNLQFVALFECILSRIEAKLLEACGYQCH